MYSKAFEPKSETSEPFLSKKRLVHLILEDVFRIVYAQTLPVLYIQHIKTIVAAAKRTPSEFPERFPGANLRGIRRLFHKAHLFRQSKHSPCLYRRLQLSTSKQRLRESTLLFLRQKSTLFRDAEYLRAHDDSPMITVASERDRATGAGARDKEESKKGFLANLRQGIIYSRSECQ